MKNKSIFVISLLAAVFYVCPIYAAKSPIKGDPELVWLSPLGDENIENNAYNRCRLIRALKPGVGKASTVTNNTYDILSSYASNLYAQAIKISAHIKAEKEAAATEKKPDISNEVSIVENEITNRLIGISRRINIINSFEASTEMIKNIQEMVRMTPVTYQDFRALSDGKYV